MSTIEQFVCDGCERPATTRRAVYPYTLNVKLDGDDEMEMEADAHDWNCFGRVISRRRKAERSAKAAEKSPATKSKKKTA